MWGESTLAMTLLRLKSTTVDILFLLVTKGIKVALTLLLMTPLFWEFQETLLKSSLVMPQ